MVYLHCTPEDTELLSNGFNNTHGKVVIHQETAVFKPCFWTTVKNANASIIQEKKMYNQELTSHLHLKILPLLRFFLNVCFCCFLFLIKCIFLYCFPSSLPFFLPSISPFLFHFLPSSLPPSFPSSLILPVVGRKNVFYSSRFFWLVE